MATHSAFIQELINVVGSQLTVARAIAIVNQEQNRIAQEAPALFRVRPDPFLATTVSTFLYTASTSVYLDSNGAQGALAGDVYDLGLPYSGFTTNYRVRYNGFGNNSRYAPIFKDSGVGTELQYQGDVARSNRPLATDCKFRFWWENSITTTTNVYRIPTYLWPTQVTSASTSLFLSLPDEYQSTLLLWRCLVYLGIQQYGGLTDIYKLAEDKLVEAKMYGLTIASTIPKRRSVRSV